MDTNFDLDPGAVVSGLRFPTYPHGSDSPRAIVCTGTIVEGNEDRVVISCEDPRLQPHETKDRDLAAGRVVLDWPWIFETRREAMQAYVRMVDQDLRENYAREKEMERRVTRIRAEHEAAIDALEDLDREAKAQETPTN